MENIQENHCIASGLHATPENEKMQHHELNGVALTISEKLRLLRTKLRLTQSDAAARFHMPVTSWKSYEKGPSEPGSGALRGLAAGGVNILWLLSDQGEMLLEDSEPQRNQADNTPSALASRTSTETKTAHFEHYNEDTEGDIPATAEDFALVPVYDVQASAGPGSHVESELKTGHLAFRRDWLRGKGLKIKDLAIITAIGDSMEPTLSDGDIMLVDTSVDKIINDAIYIVQADHHLIVKRIQQSLDGSLTIISDNQRYKEQIISPEQAKEVKIAGRVKWYGHEI